MEVTRDMDSFEALHLSEDATNEEIRKQFRFHVDMYCGNDGSIQNADGEYLFGIYQEHFKRLMDPEKKAELIEMRRLRLKNSSIEENVGSNILHGPYENALVLSKTLEAKQNYMITSINQEIVQKYSSLQSKRVFSWEKKSSLKNVYIVIGEDCSLLFTNCVKTGNSSIHYDSETGAKEERKGSVYTLYDCFTEQNIFGEEHCFLWKNIPWYGGDIFKVQGVLSIAFLASKIFPNSLIHHQKIKDCDFRQTYDIISRYLHANSNYVASLFEDTDEEEVDKRMNR